MLWEKESPLWLGERGRWEDIKIVIGRLSQKTVDHPDVVNEVEEIHADLEKNMKSSFREQFRQATSSPKMFYRCSIPAIMMFWQQWTGVNSMNYYSPVIFGKLGPTGNTIGLLELASTMSMFYIAGYHNIRQGNPKVDGASYVAIVMIYLYVTFYSFGWSVVPWPAMSESVPSQLLSLTISIGLMSNWLLNFTISKLTPILLNQIRRGTYLLFACTTLTAAIWAIFFLPETGGYAVEYVHQLWSGNITKQSLRDNKCLFFMDKNRAEGAIGTRDIEHREKGD